MRRLLAVVIAGVAMVAGPVAADDNYPNSVIKIVNPYAAGGTNAFFADLVAKSLTDQFGQSVIVEPQPGAGGNIASTNVARAVPDGYTLLAGTSGSNAVNPALYKNMCRRRSKSEPPCRPNIEPGVGAGLQRAGGG